MKLRKPRLWLRDIPGAENNQAFYLVWYDEDGFEKKRSLTAQIKGQPFPKTDRRLREICQVQAERILVSASAQIAQGNLERLERQVGLSQPTFSELFASWAFKETMRGKVVTLKEANVDSWRLSRKRASRITDDNVYDFFDHLEHVLGLSRQYCLRCLRDVRVAFDYGVLRGYCAANPAANVKPKRKPRDYSKNDDRYLTPAELHQLLETPVEEWVRNYFLWMISTACGLADMANIRWDMITEQDGREIITIPRAKNNSLTIVRYVDDLRHLLPERVDEFIFPEIPKVKRKMDARRNKLNRQLEKWCKDAALERNGRPFIVTSYMARRTAATAINNAVQDLLLAARAVGHANTQHTHRYARHDDEQRAKSGRLGLNHLGLNDTV